jgi:hypothetical protein
MTISADRPAGELKGEVGARVRPYIGQWHLESPPRIRGDRVYAEVLKYHLPQRPVISLAARSRTVTAP